MRPVATNVTWEASEVLRSRHPVLEAQRQPLDGPQAPRDARREQRIDEAVCVRQQGPALARRAGEPVLNAGAEPERHDWRRRTERRPDGRITIEQETPQVVGVW